MAQLGSTNIGTVEVRQAIGIGVDDFGLLCSDLQIEMVGSVWQAKVPHVRANRINKWSKWKPIISANTLTSAIIESAKCGLDIEVSSLTDLGIELLNNIQPDQYIWAYLPPTGTASAPYRIDDFRYYQNMALPIFNMNVADDFGVINITQPFPAVSLIHNFDLLQNQVAGGIIPADIKINSTDYLSSYYLGFMVLDLNLNPGQDVNNAIVMIKTATTTVATEKNIRANFISIPSNTDLRVAFFLSPRTHDLVYPTGGGTIPSYSDYVWLDRCLYDMVLINETAEATLWMFDRTEPSYDSFAESNANSDYYVAASTDFPTNDDEFGIVFWNDGEYFTLYPEQTINFSNGYLMKIIMNISQADIYGDPDIDSIWRNLCVYSTGYDELTGAPTSWNMIYCKSNNGLLCIGHGDPNDIEPTFTTLNIDYDSITKFEIRNYYYPSGQVDTTQVHVRIHTTDPDMPTEIYSFSDTLERMSTPVFIRMGYFAGFNYGSYEGIRYYKYDYLSIVSTPNTY